MSEILTLLNVWLRAVSMEKFFYKNKCVPLETSIVTMVARHRSRDTYDDNFRFIVARYGHIM